jgi:hypothetical protein
LSLDGISFGWTSESEQPKPVIVDELAKDEQMPTTAFLGDAVEDELLAYLQQLLTGVSRSADTMQSLMRSSAAWCRKRDIKDERRILALATKTVVKAMTELGPVEAEAFNVIRTRGAQRRMERANLLAKGTTKRHGIICRFLNRLGLKSSSDRSTVIRDGWALPTK